MEKTIQQWLKEGLSPEQFENANKFRLKHVNWDTETPDLAMAIIDGFSWNKMPEGWDYWSDKFDQLESKSKEQDKIVDTIKKYRQSIKKAKDVKNLIKKLQAKLFHDLTPCQGEEKTLNNDTKATTISVYGHTLTLKTYTYVTAEGDIPAELCKPVFDPEYWLSLSEEQKKAFLKENPSLIIKEKKVNNVFIEN